MQGADEDCGGDGVRKGLNMLAGTRSLATQASRRGFHVRKGRQADSQVTMWESSEPSITSQPPWERLSGRCLGAGRAVDMASSFPH